MILEKLQIRGEKRMTTRYRFECDHCKKQEIRWINKNSLNRKFIFCSESCQNKSQKNGVLKQSRESFFIEKYGVKNPAKAECVKENSKKTCLERYGVDNGAKSEQSKINTIKTFQKNHGVDHPQKSPIIQKKTQDTNLERYGHTCSLRGEKAKTKTKTSLLDRFGVEHNFLIPSFHEDLKKIMLERYGVDHVFKLPHVRKNCSSIEASQKRHNTMKLNGSYRQSSTENRFYQYLCNTFGVENVERQIHIQQKWSIDFYIKSINTYIQFDGVYWHGLDRSIEQIKEFKNPRDRVIYRKWLTDREQDTWFKENKLVLIRITDSEFKNNKEFCE